MGSYVYLIGSDSAKPLEAIKAPIFVQSARYELPLFWLCLFQSDDYSLTTESEETEYENQYSFFSTSKDSAIANAINREPFILDLLPAMWAPLWYEFLDFIKNSKSQFFHFNQTEHAQTCGSFEEWREKNQKILVCLDSDPIVYKKVLIFKRKYLTLAWYEVLVASGISFPALNDIMPWKLVGGEGDFVPSEKYLAMWG